MTRPPPVTLSHRGDFTLDAFRQVAWQGAEARFGPAALGAMATAREAFLALIENPDIVVYGVTSGYGQMAKIRFTPEQRKTHAARPPFAANAGFGRPAPQRISRGIVFARLANYVEGHAAITPGLAAAVAAILSRTQLPTVSIDGHGGAGEITILSALLTDVARSHATAEKDMLALVNGSPAATALLADQTLAARARFERAVKVLALAAEALMAPAEAYDAALEELWNDPDDAAALRLLRECLAGGTAARRAYQAPVSYRIAPRMLGKLHRALSAAETAAGRLLPAVTDNPVFLRPDADHPQGRVLSNGGYHGAATPPALDALTAAYADLAQIAERQAMKLLDGSVSGLPDQLMTEWPEDGRYLGCLGMAAVGWVDRAKAQATATLLPGSESGGFGANDVASPIFLAWEKTVIAGEALDATLAILSTVASQALFVTDRPAPPALLDFLAEIRAVAPPLTERHPTAPAGAPTGRLAEHFRDRTYAA